MRIERLPLLIAQGGETIEPCRGLFFSPTLAHHNEDHNNTYFPLSLDEISDTDDDSPHRRDGEKQQPSLPTSQYSSIDALDSVFTPNI
jgi:hypothetical protein